MVDLDAQPETGVGSRGLDRSRRLVAEALGTGLLTMAVVGSGIMASRLTDDVALQLLANSAATAGALIALILAFAGVSGAHFNPVVTLVDRLAGTITTVEAVAYAAAQIVGACIGVAVANVMFEIPAVDISTHVRSSGALWLSEFVATVGLLLVINGCVRTGRGDMVAVAVGVWIGGAYWFTSSDELRQPCRDHRPHPDGHVRRNRTRIGPDVRRHASRRCAGRLAPHSFAVPDPDPHPHPDPEERLMTEARPEVLFVCVHNAGRSQMAAALLARHAGDRITIRSAGTAPADTINPTVVAAMREIGIDLDSAGATPKRLTDDTVRASDVVITMGCGDECPYYPGKRYLDWTLDDPAGASIETVRAIRDDIDRRVEDLASELLATDR